MESLNTNNYLNLVGCIINTLVTFSASSIFGFPDNAALSEKYQTLVSTPTGWTFAIWGIIFLFQGIFAIVQMLPKYRSDTFIHEGVSHWYFTACIFQAAWTFAFGYEVIWLSCVFMGGILFSLLQIVKKQVKIQSTMIDWRGWIAAAFAVNAVNIFVFAAGAQLNWSYLPLVYAVLVAVIWLIVR